MTELVLLHSNKGDLYSNDDLDHFILVTSHGDGESVSAIYFNQDFPDPESEIVYRGEMSFTLDMFKTYMTMKIQERDMIMITFTRKNARKLKPFFEKSYRQKKQGS